VLEAEQPVRSVELSEDEQKAISSFGFLTQKPTLVVLSMADEQDPASVLDQVRTRIAQTPLTSVLALPGKLEMELGELSPEDAAEFMAAMNVPGSQLGDVTSVAYSLA